VTGTENNSLNTEPFKSAIKKIKQSHYRPEQALRRLRLPDFKTIGTQR
jgi:hypothetical protein